MCDEIPYGEHEFDRFLFQDNKGNFFYQFTDGFVISVFSLEQGRGELGYILNRELILHKSTTLKG